MTLVSGYKFMTEEYEYISIYELNFLMIIKNTDPYKLKKCLSCKNPIPLNTKYFTMSLSLQHVCLSCADREIPKLIQNLQQDLRKIKEELKNS
jgi:hypothetical protein